MERASEAITEGARLRMEGPRERLMRLGPGVLTDREILAVVLGTGVKGSPVQELAADLLDGGLKALVQQSPAELATHRGLGPAKAAQIAAALELGRRLQRCEEARPRLRSPQEIYAYLQPELSHLGKEVFHVLCLNARSTLLRNVRVAEGTVNSCAVDPRELFHAALQVRASAVVLAHNHPSGDPEPSSLDLSLTRQVISGANLLNLQVLDHLVIGDGKYVSFLERGLLRQLSKLQ